REAAQPRPPALQRLVPLPPPCAWRLATAAAGAAAARPLGVRWAYGQCAPAPPRAVGGHPPLADMAEPPLPAPTHALGAFCPPLGTVPASSGEDRAYDRWHVANLWI